MPKQAIALRVIADNSQAMDVNSDLANLFKAHEHDHFDACALGHIMRGKCEPFNVRSQEAIDALVCDAEEFIYTLKEIAGHDTAALNVTAEALAHNYLNSL